MNQKKFDTICLMDCFKAKYGIVAIDLILLPLGADMDAVIYKAETDDGRTYFVKAKRGIHSDISAELLALMQASGIQQIISPIKAIDGRPIQQLGDSTVIVYPFINGKNGFYSQLNSDQWIALGKALKQVHALDVPQSIKDKIKIE